MLDKGLILAVQVKNDCTAEMPVHPGEDNAVAPSFDDDTEPG